MVLLRGYFVPSVLVIALCAIVVMSDSNIKDGSAESSEKILPKPVRSNSRPLRAAKATSTTQQRSTVQHPAASHRSTAATTQAPTASTTPSQERVYEQQVLVVKGNPTEEKLNEEIRKAIRALLGPEQGDQVQIRELKSEEELRRIAPGARPVGVRLVP
uniref:Uncharacterized protein n=1 Tax=Anopheles culicifacies TaxID=139723 RepID=A0A182MSM4_9DIPT